MTLRTAVAAGLLLTFGQLHGAPRTAPPPMRLVPASIAVEGQVVLRASTSDDGHPDADAVWNYLRHRLVFQPTEAFEQLEVDPRAEQITLGWLRGSDNALRGDPPALGLEVRYGGEDHPHRMTLERVAGGAGWRVAPETVERRFGHRRITRNQARALDDPDRER
ncbi:MAG: hypothetical protein AAFZ65_07815 [Planctomycetota bacterium]